MDEHELDRRIRVAASHIVVPERPLRRRARGGLRMAGAIAMTAAVLVVAVLAGQQLAQLRGIAGPTPTASTGEPSPDLTIEEALGLALAPDALEKWTYGPGEQIERPGFYLLDISSGVAEGWSESSSGISRDDRFVVGSLRQYGLIADRHTGLVYRFDSSHARLLQMGDGPTQRRYVWSRVLGPAAHLGRVMFHLPELGQFAVVAFGEGDPRVVSTFQLSDAPTSILAALFAPDASRLALVADRVLLVDVQSGEVHAVGDRPLLGSGPDHSLALFPMADGTFVVAVQCCASQQEQTVAWARYTWEGERLAQAEIQAGVASDVFFSPDGAYVAWTEVFWHEPVALKAVMVSDGGTGEPLLRAVGTSFCSDRLLGSPWLADSSAVVAKAHLIDTAGRVVPLDPAPPGQTHELMPAPDRPDRFFSVRARALGVPGSGPLLHGAAIVDRAGREVVSIRASDDITSGPFYVWGDTSDEARFFAGPTPARGPLCFEWSAGSAPFIETAPFADYPMQRLALPGGPAELAERLRVGPHPDAEVVGSIVYPVNVEIMEMVQMAAADGACRDIWAHVRTLAGDQGWIFIVSLAGPAGSPDVRCELE